MSKQQGSNSILGKAQACLSLKETRNNDRFKSGIYFQGCVAVLPLKFMGSISITIIFRISNSLYTHYSSQSNEL
jgi:hypothetical protein